MDALTLLLVVVIAMVPGAIFYLLQHRIVFAPHYYPSRSFYAEHSKDFRLVWNQVDERVELEGLIYSPEDAKNTILYFGGKEQDSVAFLAKLAELYPKTRFITFNYRGYGHSGGKPREQLILEDALKVYDWASAQYAFVDLMGYSLGSSVAVHIASKRRTGKVILISAFDSVKALIKAKSFVLPSWLITCRFETVKFIRDVMAPVYLYTSEDDDVVPVAHVNRLKNQIRYLAGSKVFKGYNHANLLLSDVLQEELEKVFYS